MMPTKFLEGQVWLASLAIALVDIRFAWIKTTDARGGEDGGYHNVTQ